MAHVDRTTWQWIFYGNIVIPLGNPFHAAPIKIDEHDDDPFTLWLGPGLKLCLNHLLIVDHNGIIVSLAHQEDVSSYEGEKSFVRLSQHEFLCPGFIDLHIHAPQYAYTGTGMYVSEKYHR